MLFTSSTGESITLPDPTEEYSYTPKKKVKAKAKHFEHIKTMAPARTQEHDFEVAIKEVLVTEQRRPFIQKDGEEALKHAGMYLSLDPVLRPFKYSI